VQDTGNSWPILHMAGAYSQFATNPALCARCAVCAAVTAGSMITKPAAQTAIDSVIASAWAPPLLQALWLTSSLQPSCYRSCCSAWSPLACMCKHSDCCSLPSGLCAAPSLFKVSLTNSCNHYAAVSSMASHVQPLFHKLRNGAPGPCSSATTRVSSSSYNC
jgi:hypothetical protein